jgi:hypothetical protein
MKTPPKNNNALFCQKHNRAKSDSRFSAGAVWIHGYGGNTSYLLRGFSHPDFTVGFGISPNQPVPHWLADYGISPFTAGSELHSTLKLLSV